MLYAEPVRESPNLYDDVGQSGSSEYRRTHVDIALIAHHPSTQDRINYALIV
jgi:hypothetical protein